MKNDRPSETAAYVAMGRATAHARARLRGFSDPFAMQLLPDNLREVTERRLRGGWPRSLREFVVMAIAEVMERLVGPRTVMIDRALDKLPPAMQVVIVGAGLDARPYRLPGISECIVFELDHPATQALKRSRVDHVRPVARELRYVAVDLTRESLGDALNRAGHSTNAPTAWVFEGVISYLTTDQVDAAVGAMAARSASGSRLLLTYNEPNWVGRVLGNHVSAWRNEPARTVFSREEMRQLLARHGFRVCADADGLQRVAELGVTPSLIDRTFVRFHHVVFAERA
ncbi:MAG: SAM-dependent methyltransferase [Polyangiaceae bacterium]